VNGEDREILLFPLGIPPELVGGVEALLFASGEPVTAAELATALAADPQEVRLALEALRTRYTRPSSGLSLEEVAGGWQLRTATRFGGAILALRGQKPARLSQASLEVLAIVAYRQPITRHEVEGIRGVDSGGIVKGLLERGLIRVAGKRDEPGRPLEYRTTPAFLELFALKDLGEMPTLRDDG
jgi:segregation and condensation protein B